MVKTGKPVIIPHISDEPRYLNKTKSTSKLEDEDSFICVPIKAKNEIIGTLSVKLKYYSSRSFQNELQLLTIMASMLARLVRSRQDKIEEWAFKSCNVFLGVTPANGYYGAGYGKIDGFAVCNLGLTSTRNIKITPDFALPLKGTVYINPQAESIHFVIAVTL